MNLYSSMKKWSLCLLAAILACQGAVPSMAQKLPAATGHRGGAALAPENTLQALKTSMEKGIVSAEVDVSQTADGVLILLHDNNLKRTLGLNANVWDVNWGDIQAANNNRQAGPSFEGSQIPKLSTALGYIKGKPMKLNIELKHTGRETPDYVNRVLGLINENGLAQQCVITSFHYPYLERVKQLAPHVKTGYISADSSINLAGYPAADCFSLDVSMITPEMVNTAHAAGRQVYAWTVNDRAAILRCMQMGVDDIIGDNPAYIRQVIGM